MAPKKTIERTAASSRPKRTLKPTTVAVPSAPASKPEKKTTVTKKAATKTAAPKKTAANKVTKKTAPKKTAPKKAAPQKAGAAAKGAQKASATRLPDRQGKSQDHRKVQGRLQEAAVPEEETGKRQCHQLPSQESAEQYR